MPMVILVVLGLMCVIGLIVSLVMVFFVSDKERSWRWMLPLSIVIGLPSCSWLLLSWSQEKSPVQYHYIDTMVDTKGNPQHYIYPRFFDERPQVVDVKSHARLSCVLPEDTIVSVWKYNNWKNGINWLNGTVIRCEVITPSDPKYNKIKDKAVRKTLKEK